jgi:hypothetical protein
MKQVRRFDTRMQSEKPLSLVNLLRNKTLGQGLWWIVCTG